MSPVKDINKLNAVSISELVAYQRTSSSKDIKKLHKELKEFFHISEYNLIKGLVEGLEKSLILEYMIYVEDVKEKNLKLYDFWAFDKIIEVYKKCI